MHQGTCRLHHPGWSCDLYVEMPIVPHIIVHHIYVTGQKHVIIYFELPGMRVDVPRLEGIFRINHVIYVIRSSFEKFLHFSSFFSTCSGLY